MSAPYTSPNISAALGNNQLVVQLPNSARNGFLTMTGSSAHIRLAERPEAARGACSPAAGAPVLEFPTSDDLYVNSIWGPNGHLGPTPNS